MTNKKTSYFPEKKHSNVRSLYKTAFAGLLEYSNRGLLDTESDRICSLMFIEMFDI